MLKLAPRGAAFNAQFHKQSHRSLRRDIVTIHYEIRPTTLTMRGPYRMLFTPDRLLDIVGFRATRS